MTGFKDKDIKDDRIVELRRLSKSIQDNRDELRTQGKCDAHSECMRTMETNEDDIKVMQDVKLPELHEKIGNVERRTHERITNVDKANVSLRIFMWVIGFIVAGLISSTIFTQSVSIRAEEGRGIIAREAKAERDEIKREQKLLLTKEDFSEFKKELFHELRKNR